MSKDPIRYAVVGLGNIAQAAVLPGFANAENSRLVALISSDETKRRELGAHYRVERAGGYDEFEDILHACRVDAVYIATPNEQHREYTERAARAGVHVLCEKPMANTEADCRAMIRACDDHGVQLMIAYRLHFEAANLHVIDLIRSGRIGEPRLFLSMLTQQVRPGDIRTRPDVGGGAIYDEGVYPINAARYLFRDEPIGGLCRVLPGHDDRMPEVDATTSALLEFPRGRIAQFTVSQELAGVSWFRLVGTEGDLQLEGAYDYKAPMKLTVTVGGEQVEAREFTPRDQFGPELIYFSDCIQNGRTPEPSGEEGLADVRIITALLESARRGVAVAIRPIARTRRPEPDQEIDRPAVEPPAEVHAPPPTIG
ncbi:MAG TPA: Gfo/Idh/MocA family oxidoreductase [Polyangia bacterium]|nr:Gfo/Idh/MocA family oxidoreductase [Polyangia bacterium]